MNALRAILAALALPLLASVGSAQALNRIQMDNGGDGLWNVQAVAGTHTDPANGILDGDSYWTVLPARAARQCDGTMELGGFEYSIFDLDWLAGEIFWGWAINEAFVGTSGTLRPNWVVDSVNSAPVAPLVFVPEFVPSVFPFFGQPAGPGVGNCAPPGYIAGYLIRDFLLDSAGNGFGLTADGTTDYAFTHLVPNGQDPLLPPVNSCGGVGDASLSWYSSHDDLKAGQGENTPIGGLAAAVSEFNGYFRSGVGPFDEDSNGGNEVAWLITDSPTLNPYVSVQGSASTPELGTAGATLGIAFDGSGAPLPGFTSSVGVKVFDQTAELPDLAVTFGNIGSPGAPGSFLNGSGSCLPLGAVDLGLAPTNAVFSSIAWGMGIGFYDAEDSYTWPGPGLNHGQSYGGQAFGGDIVATSGQLSLAAAGASLIGAPLELQSIRVSSGAAAAASQVWLIELQEGATIL